jgi:exoribonuclease-2
MMMDIHSSQLSRNALVVYKRQPGRILAVGEKIEVELQNGDHVKVRPKDILVLHPGPLDDLDSLRQPTGDIKTAWELLTGNQTDIEELAELAYGDFTPASAWAVWQLLEDGLYFQGDLDEITPVSPEDVERQIAARQAKAQELANWHGLLERIQKGSFDPSAASDQDRQFISEVEHLALDKRNNSRLLQGLGRAESPENAHSLLLELGFWDEYVDPYPTRMEAPTQISQPEFLELPVEDRLDLTRLESFAIDDEENQDPDDAISLDGDEIWVHIADVAAMVPPESPIDLEARARGSNIYLPQGTIPMLPQKAVSTLGLGLQDESPALSFHINLSTDGSIQEVEIVPTRVRVQRLSYKQAQERMQGGDVLLNRLLSILQTFYLRRHNEGALTLDLPEVMIKVKGREVQIRPVQALQSRALVREAMLAVGEAAGMYARQHQVPIPYTIQEGTPGLLPAEDMAGQFELRKKMKRSQISLLPGPHSGLGLPLYTRATSPLRRYQDLLVHQQIRAYLAGQSVRGDQEVLNAAAMAEASASLASRAESLSRRHWTLVYLLQNPRWTGEAVLVEKNGMTGKFLITALAWETTVHLTDDLPLNASVSLEVVSIDLPNLDAYFRIQSD